MKNSPDRYAKVLKQDPDTGSKDMTGKQKTEDTRGVYTPRISTLGIFGLINETKSCSAASG